MQSKEERVEYYQRKKKGKKYSTKYKSITSTLKKEKYIRNPKHKEFTNE